MEKKMRKKKYKKIEAMNKQKWQKKESSVCEYTGEEAVIAFLNFFNQSYYVSRQEKKIQAFFSVSFR